MTYSAVITAGGRVDGAFAAAIGTDIKALAPLCGSTVLTRTIGALRASGVERIAVVGGPEVREACGTSIERFVDEAPDGAENQRRALGAWEDDVPLLYLTSDMPFIDERALRLFLDAVTPGALCLPLTGFEQFARRFPGAPPFGITLAGEKVVNGGVFALPPGAAARVQALAVRFFQARKSPLRMAALAGPSLLIAFVLRRASVDLLEARAAQLLGIPAKAVRGAPAELAYDIDTLTEYEYARAHC